MLVACLPLSSPRRRAVALVWGWCCALIATGQAVCFAAEPIEFHRDIWPIFESRCLECHGPEKQSSSLRVDSRAALLKGGELAPAVVPGDSASSYLLKLVAEGDGDLRMPPAGDPLSASEVAHLREWIAAGAPWPAAQAPADHAATHWAFQPLKCPPVPSESSTSHSGHPIDAFLTRALTARGLAMSPPADPRALIRRVTLDLTGLPPTPEEVEEFVTAVSPSHRLSVSGAKDDEEAQRRKAGEQAYAALIERLLASPRYGERWAQHWLDVIRYADTSGYEKNGIRASAWPYRDYVINALNADTPYPQFIAEQLAGDTLASDPATGFLVTAPFPSRIEIGQEIAAIAQARFNGLDEVVQNIGSALLGLTVGCARCHDHKFDPVSMRDYYRLAANFSGLQFVDRPWTAGDLPTAQIAAAELRVAELRRQLASFPVWRETHPTHAVDNFPPVLARFVRIKVNSTLQRYPAAIDEVQVWTPAAPDSPSQNVAAASRGAIARTSGANVAAGGQDAHLNDGRRGHQSLWIGNNKAGKGKGLAAGENWVEIELPESTLVSRIVWSCDYDDQGPDRVPLQWRYPTAWTIEVADDAHNWRPVITADRRADLPDDRFAARKRLEAQLKTALESLWQSNHIFAGRFRSPPAPMHVLRRGDPLQPREPVGPGGIDVLGGYELPPDTPEPERRLALARWLTSPNHPLTARVFVNRVWRHHFGAGLVETPSDFGTQGQPPTDPELLDWLATQFIAHGWRLKDLHRLICTSAAYRQSSAPHPAAQQMDADSRLLWRFPPRRLEAEAIRDSILVVSGSLDTTPGGPSVNIYQPRPADSMRGTYLPREQPFPESWRRSIYLLNVRGGDDGVFKSFDVPDCGQVRAKRSVSTTPLQALNLLNSALVIDQAERLAARAQREAPDDLAQQVDRIFALALSRPPLPSERAACLATVTEHGLATVCRVLFNSNEFLFLE